MTPPEPSLPPPPAGYRPCAGAAVFDRDGRVFMARRADLPQDTEYAWQMPQGGLDKDEPPEAGARRELLEETGVRSVTLLDWHRTWLRYDFPPEIMGEKFRNYQGQAQAWFAYGFEGDVSEIDLSAHGKPEFDTWDWVSLDAIPSMIVPFKRDVYDAIVASFQPIADRRRRQG